jgi:glycosyltransferase involved in cell wall biosynthesis
MISQLNKNLIIITEFYPYVKGEQFLYNEFIELSKRYKNVYLFPLNKSDELISPLPKNFILNESLCTESVAVNKFILSKNIFFIIKLCLIELFKNKKSIYFIRKLGYNLVTVKEALQKQHIFNEQIDKLKIKSTDTFLSTWMNLGSLILSISKHKKLIENFSFRINGFDIFDDRRLGNYMPFQAINYYYTSNVIVLSQAGFDHIHKKNIYPNKLHVNYSGQYKIGVNQLNEKSIYTIVSCSRIIGLKRNQIIAKALNYIDFEIKWVHFGDGPEMNNLVEITKSLPKNVKVELKGSIPNSEIINFYQTESVNVFVHVSETEGLGMATIEAQSFGIPAIACGVGGVPEVVTNESGILLDKNITPADLAKEIIKFKNNFKDISKLRSSTQNHFEQKFNIINNIEKFVNLIEIN